MKRFAIKGAVLSASIVALAAFAAPTMASAAPVWGPVGTNGTLTSTNLSMYVPSLATGLICTSSSLGVHVRTPASSTLDVTSASFSGCSGTGAAASGCSVALTTAGLPWTDVAVATSNIKLTGVNITATYSGGCSLSGVVVGISGTLTSGVWNASTHTVTYTGAPGLTFGGPSFGTFAMTLSGAFHNPTNTLTLV